MSSGPIRQYIGPAKRRIIDLIDDLDSKHHQFDFTLDSTLSTEENINRITQHLFELETFSQRLHRQVDQLEAKNAEWSQLLQKLTGEALLHEEGLYDTTAAGETGFPAILLQAHDILAILQVKTQEFGETKRTLETSLVSSVSRSASHATGISEPERYGHSQQLNGRPLGSPQQNGTSFGPLAKLPKIPLPRFYGDETCFKSFWDSFQSAVHNRDDIANVDKFTYLRQQVQGPALDIIEGIDVTNETYAQAVAKLTERYGSTRAIKQSLYHKLEVIPKASSNAIELQTTLDSVEKILRQLESLQENLNQTTLVNQVKNKFPPAICLKLEELKESDDDWFMGELRTHLKSVIAIRRRAFSNVKDDTYSPSAASNQKGLMNNRVKSFQRYNYRPQERGSFQNNMRNPNVTLNVQSSGQYESSNRMGNKPSTKPKSVCVFCDGLHFQNECGKFKTLDQRKQQLSLKRLCHLCFKSGHFKSNCPLRNNFKPCFYCQSTYHNKALCPKEFGGDHFYPGSSGAQTNSRVFTPTQRTSSGPNYPTRGNYKNFRHNNPKQNTNVYISGQTSRNNDILETSHVSGENTLQQGEREPGTEQQKSTPTMYIGSNMQRPNLEMLLSATVAVQNPEDPSVILKFRALLDCCSEKTYMTERAMKLLNLNADYSGILHVLGFNKTVPEEIMSDHVTFNVCLSNGNVIQIGGHTTPQISGAIRKVPLPYSDLMVVKKYGDKLVDKTPDLEEQFVPDLLLGVKCFLKLVQTDHLIELPSGLFLVPSKFGLLIGGSNEEILEWHQENDKREHSELSVISAMNISCEVSAPLTQVPTLKEMYSLETIGISDDPSVNQDDLALQRFNKTLKFENGKYNMAWMWKDDIPKLPHNRYLALKRFHSLIKRYSADPAHQLIKACDTIIQDQFQNQVIEKVNDESIIEGPLHYLPHRAVVTPDKTTTKTRIVMDGSAKANSSENSLNDCLFRGPIIMPQLPGISMRFRLKPYGIISDIAKAFLQMWLHRDQRDCTRFFWLKNIDHKPILDPDNIQVYRFTRVLFGAKCSPSMLNLTIDFHLSKYESDVAKLIRNNMYVDNFIGGGSSVSDCIRIYKEGKQIFSEAGMNLREWICNSQEFMSQIADSDRPKGNLKSVSVLGLQWDPQQDTLSLKPVQITKLPHTKRKFLELTSSFFDPLGYCGPILIGPKLFVQQLWKLKVQWDEPLPQTLIQKFEPHIEDLKSLADFKVDRFIGLPDEPVSFHIITFSDASKVAYSANVYLCVTAATWSTLTLLFSKSKLAPIQGMSVPRLELIGAVIGVKCSQFVKTELHVPVKESVLYTDSQCILHWLQSKKKLPIFVENRIKTLKSASNMQFKYIASSDNPADLATKPQNKDSFKQKQEFWQHGPSFMKAPFDKWPEFEVPELTPATLEEAETENSKHLMNTTQTISFVTPATTTISIIDPQRFSSLKSLLMFTSLMLLMIQTFVWNKLSQGHQSKYPYLQQLLAFPKNCGLTSQVFTIASNYWTNRTQKLAFPDLLQAFRNNKPHPMIKQMNLFLDNNGLIRLKGRLQHAPISYDSKHPILLPSKTWFTRLVILDAHTKMHHVGTETTLGEVRQKWWITRGRRSIQEVIKQCPACLKMKGLPFKLPLMASLPFTRFQKLHPFKYVGVDYFGPMTVKVLGVATKIWVALFTCFMSRAVHLEFVSSLDSQHFINCLRRFIARRGKPSLIISDNASQFKLAQKTLDTAWETAIRHPDLQSYCSGQQIMWHFITELAPWKGGMYERLVGLVKSVLKMALGRHQPKFEDFLTYLAESEAIVNSRPLVHITEDPNDQLSVLRPIDYIVPKAHIGAEILEDDRTDPEYFPTLDSTGKMMKWWRSSQKYIDDLWVEFLKKYLPSLHERYQSAHAQKRGTSSTAPRINQVVLIHEENIPRGCWKLGVITKLKRRNDGEISEAEVQTSNKNTIRRTLNFLYPLEIDSDQPETDVIQKQNGQNQSRQTPINSTPDNNRRVTRSMTRSQTLLSHLAKSMVIISTLLLGVSASSHSLCPETANLSIVDSTTCVQEGIVVKQFPDSKYCWSKIKCNTGQHIRDEGKCGYKCPCPSWSSACSYSKKFPDIGENLKIQILTDEKPNICSFLKDSRCNEKSTIGKFNQVQLSDGTKHLVKSLNVVYEQAKTEQYTCIGSGQITGTEVFCQNQHCNPEGGTKFCFYKEPEITYLDSDSGKLPIKAWGTVSKKYYGDKSAEKFHPSCQTCEISCITGGIKLELEENIGKILICPVESTQCISLSNPSQQETVFLKPDIVLHDYNIEVQLFYHGYKIRTLGVSCKTAAFCETINCFFCEIHFQNLHCFSKTYGIIAIVLLLVILFTSGWAALYFILKIFHLLLKIVFFLIKGSAFAAVRMLKHIKLKDEFTEPGMNFSQSQSADNTMQSRSSSRKKRSRRIYEPRQVSQAITIATVLLSIFNQVNGCSKATTLTATSKQCKPIQNDSKAIIECIMTEVTRLVLVPEGQATCLLIGNDQGSPLGTLKIITNRIQLQCQAVNQYYTKSFQMHVESSKRCPKAGSCTGDKCSQYTQDSKFDELSDNANTRPGFSHCVESCACWGCDCFYCTSGCLFYRIFAEPLSETTYEVFECSIWKFKVDVTTEMHLASGNIVTHTLSLYPGIASSWRNIEMTLVGVVNPPSPLLNKKFITDGERVIITEASNQGQPVAGTVGAIQCPSKKAADEFNTCYLPLDICLCDPQETKVKCTCSNQAIEPLFSNNEYALPFETHGLLIQGTETNITATLSAYASMEIQVSVEDLRLLYFNDISICIIKPKSLIGCYSCYSGARFSYTCMTDMGDALAHVKCGETMFSTKCSTSGFSTTTTLSFSKPHVDQQCVVTCPAKDTTFTIKGDLVFIEKLRLNNISDVLSKAKKSDNSWNIGDIEFPDVFSWLKNNWTAFILAVIGIIFIALIIILFAPVILQFFSTTLRNCSKKTLQQMNTLKQSILAKFRRKNQKSSGQKKII